MPVKTYRIKLTEEERSALAEIADAASGSKERRRRANILLLTDESGGGAAMTDAEVARALRCPPRTVARVRQRCFEAGPRTAVERSLRLIAGRLVELEVVDSISHSTVGRSLIKTTSSPGS